MKYKAFKDFYNPVSKKNVKKGEVFEVDTSRANTFHRVATKLPENEEVKEETKDEVKEETKKDVKEEAPKKVEINLSNGKKVKR